jgi:hypothetical protein
VAYHLAWDYLMVVDYPLVVYHLVVDCLYPLVVKVMVVDCRYLVVVDFPMVVVILIP